MEVEIALNLLREACELGVEVVDLTGGEPSLHSHFLTITKFALSMGFKQLNISTNGFGLNLDDLHNFNFSFIVRQIAY